MSHITDCPKTLPLLSELSNLCPMYVPSPLCYVPFPKTRCARFCLAFCKVMQAFLLLSIIMIIMIIVIIMIIMIITIITVKERRTRMPKKRGWGRATTRQNLRRSRAD